MGQVKNINIQNVSVLSSPIQVHTEYPLTNKIEQQIAQYRQTIQDILDRKDPRFLLITGPCSIHHHETGAEYAKRLKKLSERVSDKIFIVMRAYFEKPRTTLGWKGMIYDPFLNNSNDIEAGVRLTRQMLLQIAEQGLPIATEILEPIIPQYICDLISWSAIGARTAESQTHRQMASGLSMPIGFKNSTDGSLNVAVEAIKTAKAPHTFIGIDEGGHVACFRTKGNAYGHVVLRGGRNGPNYTSEYIAFVNEIIRKSKVHPGIIIDCSHANSGKDPKKQPKVLKDVIKQRQEGAFNIVGAMLESNLLGGRQDIPEKLSELIPGLSITDACLGWEDTERTILDCYNLL